MIKRILVALDPDEDTTIATRYAAELAKRFGAEVTGLAIVDTKHIATEVGAGGAIGGLYYAEQVRHHVADTTRAMARELTNTFHSALEQEHIPHGERVEDGVPYRRIIEDMKYHDLLVIGKVPHFFYRRPEQETNTLAQVVKRGVAPTLVVGEAYHAIERVLLAYDGSDAAARTIQRFVQLQPFGTSLDLDIVYVRQTDSERERRESELLLRLLRAFLQAHGFTQITEFSMDGGSPGTRLLEHARQFGADLIVAGAHSVSAMRRAAFGSTTHTLLERCPVPLFLFH